MDVTCIPLTIFTPTYNRARLLPRLFESISAQAAVGDPVEWLVVDDGSLDETPAVLEQFRARRPDLVRVVRVANGGKHRAINLAARLAAGDWLMIVDSDDMLADGALADMREALSLAAGRSDVGIIRAPCQFADRPIDSFKLPANPCHHYEWVSHQAPFDTAELLCVDILRDNPFSEWPGERFQAESLLRFRVDRAYMTYFWPRPWIAAEYQADGLSANSRSIRASSPLSACDVYVAMAASPAAASVRRRAAINWWRYRFHAVRRYGFSRQPPLSLPLTWSLPGLVLFLGDLVAPKSSG